MRQLYKHVVGIETTSNSATKDHAFNEISGRYCIVKQYYYPIEWRTQSKDNKQCSAGVLLDEKNKQAKAIYEAAMKSNLQYYDQLLDLGVAKEQARLLLPLSQYTECIWTCSLQAVLNMISLRNHYHAQIEIQLYAKSIKKMLELKFPKLSEIIFDENNY